MRIDIHHCSVEGWGVPDRTYITRNDYPKAGRLLPRTIPEDVVEKLESLRSKMNPEFSRQVTILLGTGMRIVELVTLRFNCLWQDHVGDYFIRFTQVKMHEEHSIPIPLEVIAAIKEQQESIILWHKKQRIKVAPEYLFIGRFGAALKGDGPSLNPQHPSGVRSKLHTVGTRLINNGMNQSWVQKFFNHKSPDMTARYSHLSNQTLKEEFAKVHGRLINIYGQVTDSIPENSTDLQWLKKNILAQALPNGFCGLPIIKGGCPHANACLLLQLRKHWVDNSKFLPSRLGMEVGCACLMCSTPI